MAQGHRTRNYPSPNTSLAQAPYTASYGSVSVNGPPNTSTPQVTAPTAIMHAKSELRQQGIGVIDLTSDSDWDSTNIPHEAVSDSRFRAYNGLRTGQVGSGMQTLGLELFPGFSQESAPSRVHTHAPGLASVDPSQYGYHTAFQNTPQEQGATRKRCCADGNESQPAGWVQGKGQRGAYNDPEMSGVAEYPPASSEAVGGGLLAASSVQARQEASLPGQNPRLARWTDMVDSWPHDERRQAEMP